MAVEANVGEEPDLRVDVDDVGEHGELPAGVVVEDFRLRGFARVVGGGCLAWRAAGAVAAGAAEITARGDEDGVEKTRLGKAIGGKSLQADAERQHRHKRRNSNGDT